MSRIGIAPIKVPDGVKVDIRGDRVSVSGPRGTLERDLVPGISARLEDGEVRLSRAGEDKKMRALHGTMRSLIANMVEGVHKGFSKELEIHGVGFRPQLQGKKLVIQAGYSHPLEFDPPEGVELSVSKDQTIVVSGPDKQAVGQISARIRTSYSAEPYKGKGIRYKGEPIRRKAGKTVA
jgi:large subunit ribosomal protein L6